MTLDIITMIGTVIGSVIASLGGWEVVRYFFFRKTEQREATVHADIAEFERYAKEVEYLHGRLVFMEETLAKKEERFQEKIMSERKLLDEINELTTELAKVKAIMEMKLCEVRNCPKRQPQTGFY